MNALRDLCAWGTKYRFALCVSWFCVGAFFWAFMFHLDTNIAIAELDTRHARLTNLSKEIRLRDELFVQLEVSIRQMNGLLEKITKDN